MGTIIGTLGDLGYSVAYRVLDAQYFGLAQRRRRVFIVGYLGDDWRPPASVLFESEGSRGDTPARQKAREDIAGTLESRTRGGGFPGTDGATANHVIAQPITASNSGDSGRPHVVGFYPNNRNPDEGNYDDQAPTVKAGQGNMNPPGVVYAMSENQRAEVVLTEYAHQLSTNGGKPGQDYPAMFDPGQMIVRRLTPKECERLQGFPDDWTKYGWKIPGATGKRLDALGLIQLSNTRRYRALGNAFPVPVVAWILSRLVVADER